MSAVKTTTPSQWAKTGHEEGETAVIVDLFAGPGGWDEGLAMLGRRDVLGIEWDEVACLTAEAAGHRRLAADVAALDPADFALIAESIEGVIASPPCQAWSLAGKQLGELDQTKAEALAVTVADKLEGRQP